MKALAATSPATPGRVGREGQRAGLGIDRNRHAAALALAQRGVEPQALAGHAGRKRLLGRPRGPLLEIGPGGLLAVVDLLLDVRNPAVEGLPALAVLGRAGDEHHRRGVLDVAVHRRLRRVVEERRQAVELLLRQGIELVIVADRAIGRQPHPDPRSGLGAIAGIEHQVLFADHAAFVGGDVAAVEARGDPLFVGGVGQQVAGQLLDR